MKTRTVIERIGEDCGPIDWEHEIARDRPAMWREAEQRPERYRLDRGNLSSFRVLALRMYDGWPYWTARPAICFVGPIGTVEWAFFDSYGVTDRSLFEAKEPSDD